MKHNALKGVNRPVRKPMDAFGQALLELDIDFHLTIGPRTGLLRTVSTQE